MCTIHKQPFIIFCSDCEKLICQHCTLKDHLGHNYEFTTVAALGVKTKLLEDAQSLKTLNKEVTDADEKIRSMMLEVETQKNLLSTTSTLPSRSYNTFWSNVNRNGVKMPCLFIQKLQNLSQQEKTLSLESKELQSVADYTE